MALLLAVGTFVCCGTDIGRIHPDGDHRGEWDRCADQLNSLLFSPIKFPCLEKKEWG